MDVDFEVLQNTAISNVENQLKTLSKKVLLPAYDDKKEEKDVSGSQPVEIYETPEEVPCSFSKDALIMPSSSIFFVDALMMPSSS
ncbi:hypothetical protein L6452_22600 [Arctium lappa]|uniref:Uncharacterized protein n=1 Tax=Arctium lappa TaxID=4217 RepID=A0ACB9B157_ARCLA|nr:hypothetical protein L6452_22600 [Arctium lappa]